MSTRSTERHQGREPSSASMNIAKKACNHCHRRKVKCDISEQGIPCTNCTTRKLSGCLIHEKRRRLQRPVALPTLRPKHYLSTTKDVICIPREMVPVHTIYDENSAGPTSDEEHEAGNIADFLGKDTIRAGELEQKSRVCYIGSEPSNFHYLVRQSTNEPDRDGRIHHFSNRQYNVRHTSYRLDSLPADAFARPDKALESELIEAYFRCINRAWPIVDEDRFRTQLAGNDKRYPITLMLYNAVLVVGAHVLSRSGRPDMKHHQGVFFRRTKALMDARAEQDRLVYVQASLLLTWFADGLEEVVANSWHWIGFAARTAVGIGMHRDVSHAKHPPVQKRMWCRVWWVLFQFDTLLSLAYGRPQALNLDDCDVPELQPADFEGIQSAECEFAMQHTRLCILTSQIMRYRWALRPTSRLNQAGQSVDQQLADFAAQLPASMQPPAPYGPAHQSPWAAMLHITYNTVLVLVHREPPESVLVPSISEPRSPIVAAEATTQLTRLMQGLHASHALQQLSFFGVHSVWTAMLQLKADIQNPSPLVSTAASRAMKVLLAALLELSYSWNFAQGLARLFGETERESETTKKHEQLAQPTQDDMAPLNESLVMDFGLLEDFFMGYEDAVAVV